MEDAGIVGVLIPLNCRGGFELCNGFWPANDAVLIPLNCRGGFEPATGAYQSAKAAVLIPLNCRGGFEQKGCLYRTNIFSLNPLELSGRVRTLYS